MVQHVYERALMSRFLTEVVVATDDERIFAAVRKFGGRVRMTSSEHPTGTDRLAEVASAETAHLYVNIQGDEPLIDPTAIDAAVWRMLEDEAPPMGTLKKAIINAAEITNPNVVKVVTDAEGFAIYFSRLPIPFQRDAGDVVCQRFKHIGLYVYRRDFLLQYPSLAAGPLESAERLEQLRALENGYRIRVVETDYESIGVDTPADLNTVEQLFAMAAHMTGSAKHESVSTALQGGACLNTSS